MPKFIDQSDIDQIVFRINQSGAVSKNGYLVGYVKAGDAAFPTHRPDMSALKDLDYVHVDSTSTLPFTIESITFTRANDIAYYEDGHWYLGSSDASISAYEAKRYMEQSSQYATQSGNSAIIALNAADAAKAVVWKGTRAQYNALETIDPNCMYFIINEA